MELTTDFDAIIVGSGPAGVSVAFPLLEAGLRVLLVDGGQTPHVLPPAGPFLDRRASDPDQWKWMVGRDYHALRKIDALSPKLRVPTHDYVFDGFEAQNRVHSNEFVTIGSLARGGLSNAWGCGIARLSGDELSKFPFTSAEIDPSYEAVARRIGISGAVSDDMSGYFGVDAWAKPPIQMDAIQSRLFDQYLARRTEMLSAGFRLGRSRVAALSENLGERQACDLSGTCLWGCHRRALYSAVEDLALLRRYANFYYRPGFIVDKIASQPEGGTIFGGDTEGYRSYRGRRVILAAGTLASTRLALDALDHAQPVALQSCPSAAFLLWMPRFLGRNREAEFGLGQLSFALSIRDGITGFGSLFGSTGIPVSEFVRYIPFRRRYGIDILKTLLSSCLVGNMFLPGHLTRSSLTVRPNGVLDVEGDYASEVHPLMAESGNKLRTVFRKLGGVVLPMSFKVGRPGGDIHYSSSLPMRLDPVRGETTEEGELHGLKGIHVVDGACLSSLNEKSHTLTLMANADRIGTKLARRLANK